MNDLVELYKRRNALAQKGLDTSEVTNEINKKYLVKEPKPIILTHSYYKNPDFYEHYDNFDAIEVPRVELIPYDYDGIMGVPLTFLGARNRIYIPDYTSMPKCNETQIFCINYLCSQFTIIGLAADKRNENPLWIKGKETYLDEKHKKFVGMILNGKATYARIIIKKVS